MFMWWTWKDIKHTALYLHLTALHTNTQRCKKPGHSLQIIKLPMETHNSHSLRNNWLENFVRCVCVCVCAFVSLCVYLLFVYDLAVPVAWPLSRPPLSTHVLSHMNVLHCLSFSLKPTDQWDSRVSRLYDWVFSPASNQAQLTATQKKTIFW